LKGRLEWIASLANEIEIRRNPDEMRRSDGLKLLSFAGDLVEPDIATRVRSAELERSGYGAFDALHLACAEQSGVVALLTTDDRFISRAARKIGDPKVSVVNPVDWLREVEL
jgi:predicted nucleic acid-binding protein